MKTWCGYGWLLNLTLYLTCLLLRSSLHIYRISSAQAWLLTCLLSCVNSLGWWWPGFLWHWAIKLGFTGELRTLRGTERTLLFHLVPYEGTFYLFLIMESAIAQSMQMFFGETVGCHVFKGPSISSVYAIGNWDTQAALQGLFWCSNALAPVPVSWYSVCTSTFMVTDLSRFVLVSKYVLSGPRFAVLVGFRYLLFLRAAVTLCSSLKITLSGFSIEIIHLDSCPLLGLLLTDVFLWLFPSLEREVRDRSEEGLLQSFSSPSGKPSRDLSISWMLWPAFSDFRFKREGS